jgi:hypothetical protein
MPYIIGFASKEEVTHFKEMGLEIEGPGDVDFYIYRALESPQKDELVIIHVYDNVAKLVRNLEE